MDEEAASTKPSAPRPADVLRMLRQLRRGSAADAPLGLLPAVREFVRGTPSDSKLTLRDVTKSSVYRDLSSAKVRPGEPAADFELPRLDGAGEAVRLSAFHQVSPVALIFGSYT